MRKFQRNEDLLRGGEVGLQTHWGTRIYYDADKDEVRHGPVHLHPPNVTLLACGAPNAPSSGAVLLINTGASVLPARCTPDGRLVPGEPKDAEIFRIVLAEPGALLLRSRRLYLSADPDGRVLLGKQWPGWWEKLSLTLRIEELGANAPLSAIQAARDAHSDYAARSCP